MSVGPLARSGISWTLTLLAIAGISWLLFSNVEHVQRLTLVSWPLGPLLIAIACGPIIRGAYTKLTAAACGVEMCWSECVCISVITTAGNFFTSVGGGTAARAAYLKQRHRISYSVFISTQTFCFLIMLAFQAGAGFLTALFYQPTMETHGRLVTIFFASVAIGMVLLVWLAPRVVHAGVWTPFPKLWNSLASGIEHCRSRTLELTCWIVLNSVCAASAQWFAFRCLGLSLSFSELILVSSISVFGMLVSVTPGGLGITEAFTMLSSRLIGLSMVDALTMSLLHRAATAIVLAIATPLAMRVLGIGWKRNKTQSLESLLASNDTQPGIVTGKRAA